MRSEHIRCSYSEGTKIEATDLQDQSISMSSDLVLCAVRQVMFGTHLDHACSGRAGKAETASPEPGKYPRTLPLSCSDFCIDFLLAVPDAGNAQCI